MELQRIETATEKEQIIDQEVILTKEDLEVFIRGDGILLRILKNFYFSGRGFPLDVETYAVSQLQKKLENRGINIGLESLRYRMEQLVKVGMLTKIKGFITHYQPIKDVDIIREKILQFEKIIF